MEPKDESISPEEYGTLMEKLTKVEGLFEKAAEEKVVEDEVIGDLNSTIEKLTEEIDVLKNAEPKEVESVSADDISKMVADAIKDIEDAHDKRLDVLEKSPFMKGVKDGDGAGIVEKKAGEGALDDAIAKAYGMKVE